MVVMAPFTLGVETVFQVCEPAAEYTGHAAESMQLLLATVSTCRSVCCAVQDQPVWISGPECGGITAGLWCPQSCGSVRVQTLLPGGRVEKGGGLEVLRP